MTISNHCPQMPLPQTMQRPPQLRYDLIIFGLWVKAWDLAMDNNKQAQIIHGIPYPIHPMPKRFHMRTCALEQPELLLVALPIKPGALLLEVSFEVLEYWAIDNLFVHLEQEEAACKKV
jgi:hypothetical protein